MSVILNMQTFTSPTDFSQPNFINSAQTTVNGSVSGSIIVTMPQQGSAYKKVIIYSNMLDGTASYTFPTSYSFDPEVLVSSSLSFFSISSLTPTSITVSASSGQTGFVILEGF